MSAKQWALSLFFVWHIAATGLGSLARPDPTPSVDTSESPLSPLGAPPDQDLIAGSLQPALDAIAATVAPFPETLALAGGPLRRPAAIYRNIIGSSQNWKMFSIPPQVHQYLRVRYYVGSLVDTGEGGGSPSWTATELVLPAHREDTLRLFQAYRDSFRDKAVTIALQRFYGKRDARLIKADTTSAELPNDLAPIGRYFARRFERQALQASERILRTEIWSGVAPMPPPGIAPDRARVDARLSVLHDYYAGPVQNHFGRRSYPAYHVAEEEADITWVLEYFEP